MRPHPRIRKTIKWGGAVVTAVLLVVWFVSAWWIAAWSSDGGRGVSVITGYVVFYHNPPIPNRNFFLTRTPSNAPYLWGWRPLLKANPPKWQLYIPLWMPFLIVAPITVVVWRFDALAHRRAPLNPCRKCGYDRAGIARNTVCPECGSGPA